MAEGSPCEWTFTVGIRDMVAAPQALHLYPNPATNSLTIDLGQETGPGDLQIFDARGALVAMQRITGPVTTIDVGALDTGISGRFIK